MLYATGAIHVRTQIADVVLNREGRDVLARLGLKLIYAPEEFINVRQVYRDETPQEQAATAAHMTRLCEALTGKRKREDAA
jgi:hypothetical protein